MNLKTVVRVLKNFHENRNQSDPPFSEYLDIINAREKVLSRFRPIFRDIENLSEADFRDFLSFKHNCHWTGLERSAKHLCDDMPLLRNSLMHILDDNLPIVSRMDDVLSGTYSIKGLGKGTLTAVLLTSYPESHSVWNGKSEAAMKCLGIWPSFERGSSNGVRYKKLNQICFELSKLIGIGLWELDGLWHVVNEKSRTELDDALNSALSNEREFWEGGKTTYEGLRTERNSKARDQCISKHGVDCAVCGFNFFRTYGELGLGFIHVHHREDLSLRNQDRPTDPEKDLVPVCPNCHAMLHKGKVPCRSIEELKGILESNQNAT